MTLPEEFDLIGLVEIDTSIGELLEEPGYKLNSDKTVAVSGTQYWEPIETCPRGVKVQLLGAGGVAAYAQYDGRNRFWVGWAPLPRKREHIE